MSDTPTIFHHILVPTDGSQPSVAAGQLAIKLAVLHRAFITFVYVVDTSVVEHLTDASGKVALQVRQELELTAQHYLDYLSRLAKEANVPSDQVIRNGTPYTEIEALAREQNIDLIVIGQVGHHGARHVLIGSVTERVIEYAPCPVLVAK